MDRLHWAGVLIGFLCLTESASAGNNGKWQAWGTLGQLEKPIVSSATYCRVKLSDPERVDGAELPPELQVSEGPTGVAVTALSIGEDPHSVYVGLADGSRGILWPEYFQREATGAPFSRVASIEYHPDRIALAACDHLGTVSLSRYLERTRTFEAMQWHVDLASGEIRAHFVPDRATPTAPRTLRTSGDGHWLGLLTQHERVRHVHLFGLAPGRDQRWITRSIALGTERPTALAFSPSTIPSLLAVGTLGGEVRVWHTDDGTEMRSFRSFPRGRGSHRVHTLQFGETENGAILAAGLPAGVVHLWNFGNGVPTEIAPRFSALTCRQENAVTAMEFAPGGTRVAISTGKGEDSLELWKVPATEKPEFEGFIGAQLPDGTAMKVSRMAFSKNGKLLVALSEGRQRRIVVFDTITHQVVRAYRWPHADLTSAFVTHPNREYVWIGTTDGKVIRLDLHQLEQERDQR